MIEEIQKINKLVAIYGRVSTSNQENEGTIETQLSAIRQFAKENGYIIVREYLDNGWSGDTLIRPSLDELRVDAKKKIWEAVLIFDPDRLARRYSYQELIMDELREAGTEVIFLTTPAPKDYGEKILYGVKGLFAEYERAKISERFRLGKLRKVKEGHLLVSEPLYGFDYVPKIENTHGYYVINPEEARVAKMIFTWIGEERLTIRGVVNRLQEQGIKPRKSKRGVWNTSTLSHMLRNKAYIGEARWGSSYAVVPVNPINKEKYRKLKKSSRKNKPESEWIASKIPVPAIIDKELFFKVGKRLDINSELNKRNTRNEYLLTQKIYCICGRRRTGESALKGKHLYYRCTDRILQHPLPKVCKEKGINARLADRKVWNKLTKFLTSKKLMTEQANRWLRRRKDKTKLGQGDLSVMLKEINRLEAQEDRYNKAYGAGVFTVEKLKEYTLPITNKISSLENQIAKYKLERENVITSMPEESDIEAYTEDAKNVIKTYNFAEKKAVIMDIINKIIGTKTELKVAGSVPVYEQNAEFKTSDRNCGVAKCWQVYFI